MYDSDESDDITLPAGEAFVEVTSLFRDAAQAMHDDEILLTDGFTLLDSMSAIEIGEPRMDTGVIPEKEKQPPPFEPLAPLLPSELCYILDRTFACEMEWHQGTTLTQTIYTFLYIYHYDDIDPDRIPFIPITQRDPDPKRPMELVTLVLRACVAGYLKCCDMAWRELNRSRVFDTEDWQSEKGSGSLMEGLPVRRALTQLDDAFLWLSRQTPETLSWKAPLLHRLQLRKSLLEVLSIDPNMDVHRYRHHLTAARHHLSEIRFRPSPPPPSPSSPALLAFDPNITRRLNSYMPLKALQLPDQDETWARMQRLLDGLEELCEMAEVKRVTTWNIIGDLHATARPQIQTPYLRSLTQSVYFDDYRILGKLPPRWIVDSFFLESLGISYEAICYMATSIPGPPMPMKEIEGDLVKVLTKRIRLSWANSPRRRRALCNSLWEWHGVYSMLKSVADHAAANSDSADVSTLRATPKIALLWRLETILHVILSGFQLELYVSDERAFAYWYAADVMDEELKVLEYLVGSGTEGERGVIAVGLPEGEVALEEMLFKMTVLQGLKELCWGMFVLTLPQMTYSPERLILNLRKRYKWAFIDSYQWTPARPVGHPDVKAFLDECERVLADESLDPSQPFRDAYDKLAGIGIGGESGASSQSEGENDDESRIAKGTVSTGWAIAGTGKTRWADERRKFIEDLSVSALNLSTIAPKTLGALASFDCTASLIWNKTKPYWFPGVQPITRARQD